MLDCGQSSRQKRGLPGMEHCFGEVPVCAARAVHAMGRRKLMHQKKRKAENQRNTNSARDNVDGAR
jgi:hypothetical protein